jgi:Zn ribbon nucleic-acid-binding protein
MNVINECPECGTRDTDRQMLDWHRDGVDVMYSCYDCEIDFVASLRQPIKEVIQEYE